jgi:hypothetical protein
MMYIIRQSDKDAAIRFQQGSGRQCEPKEYNWHVGEKRPRHQGDLLGFDDVCEVYADSHELEHIRRLHTNLPDVPTANSIVWRGDFAQFIYDHLPAFAKPAVLDESAHYR